MTKMISLFQGRAWGVPRCAVDSPGKMREEILNVLAAWGAWRETYDIYYPARELRRTVEGGARRTLLSSWTG